MNFNNNHRYSGSMAEGFMSKVYGWMCVGLSVTAAVSYYLSPDVNPQLLNSLKHSLPIMIGVLIASVGLIMYMSWNYANLSYTTLSVMFITFCALEGIALAPLLSFYTGASVFYVFLIAATMFAVMAVYGWLTNADLSSMGNILFMGMIGLMVANIINMFVRSSGFDLVISSVGVGIFAMLTAYDVQRLKQYSHSVMASPDEAGKFALMGALGLFLNMINMFIYLLRLFGEERKK